MRHARVVGAVFALLCVVLAPGPANAADKRETLIDQILAKADPKLMEVLVTSQGDDGRPEFDTIKVPNLAAAKLQIDELLGAPGILGVEMNRIVRVAATDTHRSKQWAINNRHLNLGHIQAVTAGDSARPIIAVVDSGVQSGHPDLAGRVTNGYDFIARRPSQSDSCGHGTHVAGIIAANINNGQGVAGLNRLAYIRPVKVLQRTSGGGCEGSLGAVAEGIRWAATRANVINLSLEFSGSSAAVGAAVQDARSRGRAVIASAGNYGCGLSRPTIFPASYPGVVGVAAADNHGSAPYWRVASYSSCGNWVDVIAPGSGILSTCPTSGYCWMSGTSMAAPYVAATVALGMQHCGLSAATSATRVQTRASHYPSRSNSVGFGMILPARLLTCR